MCRKAQGLGGVGRGLRDKLESMPGPAENPNYVYSVQSLRAGYGAQKVLKGLDWELEAGESFAILGPSGEGKTLLFKLLSGLRSAQSGSVKFQGKDLRKMSEAERRTFRENIGMTFQKDGLFDSLTCADNLRFPLNERLRLSRKEREKRVEEALEGVGLAGQGKLFVHEMSGGMQKRLGIARALLFSPRVILYDEPAAGLDPITSRTINELIRQMRDRYQMTVVMITSDLDQARQVCTRMGLMWNGRFEEQGTWSSLRASKNPVVHQFLHALPDGPLTEGAA